MNRRLRNALCWCWFVYCLLLFAGRSAEANHHAALIFPPLLSLRCFERVALSTFFVYMSYTRWRAFSSLRAQALNLLCSSTRYPNDAPAGASAWGGCPLCALLILAGAAAAFRPASPVGECCFLKNPIEPASDRRNGHCSTCLRNGLLC